MHDQDHILDRLDRHASAWPDKPFIHDETGRTRTSISYGAFAAAMRTRAASLAAAGVASGGVVLVFMPQGWEGIALFFAAIHHGCAASFMPLPSNKQDPDHYWASHRTLIERIEPVAIVAQASAEAVMRRNGVLPDGAVFYAAERATIEALPPGALATARRDGPAPILQHSSGTTGLKKGVALSHAAILNQAATYAASIGATAEDVVVSWLPVYHDMGLVACTLLPMLLGQTIVLLDPFIWVARPALLFDAIARHQGTLCWLPNFAFEHLVRILGTTAAQYRLESMRAFIDCSEPCFPTTLARFAAVFAPSGVTADRLQVCYAMAETVFAVTQTPLDRPPRTLLADRVMLHEGGRFAPGETLALLSAGPPLAGTSLSIRDEHGRPVQDGVAGEIWVRSRSLFSGYFRNEETTAERLRDGNYRTRDRGFLHEGELYVLGRLDDLIIVSGRNFHASEIEAVVSLVAGIKPGRAVALGVINEARGTAELVIMAELDTDAAAASEAQGRTIRQAIRSALSQSFNVTPADIVLTQANSLRKTTSGKIERRSNLERYLARKTRPADAALPGGTAPHETRTISGSSR